MTLEIFLWILAGFVLSEGIFIYGLYKGVCSSSEFQWPFWKFVSFFFGGMFIFIQIIIIFPVNEAGFPTFLNGNYINLFYEFFIIIGIFIFFYLNKLIADKFNQNETN